MANVRDSDTSLWLHNKLGTSNDSWTGGSICSQLNVEVLRNIRDCFPDLQTQVKLKLLLSFFHIPRRNLDEWRVELEQILDIATIDSELWVSMVAETLKTYPATGSLNPEITDSDETRRIFSDLVNELRKLVKRQSDFALLPLECHYLNKPALASVVGEQPSPQQHFLLRKKPKSAYIRAELLQKASDVASNMKKSSAPVIPVRSRGMPRKMTDTTPLKGIPSRVPASGFRSSLTNSGFNSRPQLSRTPAGRKEGGVKLLDIAEQPLGYAAAKKRRRLQELEDSKKTPDTSQPIIMSPNGGNVQPATPATPDYAAGLTSNPSYAPETPAPPPTRENVPATPSTPQVVTSIAVEPPTPAYAAAIVTPQSSISHIAPSQKPQIISQIQIVPGIVTANQINQINQIPQAIVVPQQKMIATVLPQPQVHQSHPPQQVQQQPAQHIVTQQVQAMPVRQTQVTQVRIPPPVTQNPTQKKSLSLTRDQMIEAQDMFRTANKVTRPEKALILGFMAGSRENPCPNLGNLVTIKLAENQEQILQMDTGTAINMTVETHFQMNYTTGEWKRIKKYRPIENSIILEPSKQQHNAQTALT